MQKKRLKPIEIPQKKAQKSHFIYLHINLIYAAVFLRGCYKKYINRYYYIK